MFWKSSSNGLFIFIFNLPLFVLASRYDRRYVYVETPMNWNLAQEYCKKHHTDLATIRNGNELDALDGMCGLTSYCWIGVQRDNMDINVWIWSDGDTTNFTNWASGQPDFFDKNEYCVIMSSLSWFDYPCKAKLAFLCYDNLILVKENKTWEEALEHCRTLDTDSTSSNNYVNQSFDLPHMDFVVRNLESEKVIQDSQTPEVWIGLRFLAGEWLWVNGMPLLDQPQACPPAGMHCGTMSKTGIVSPMRNCVERRNFLCLKSD